MALPASLIQHVEQHGCFTGCFGSDTSVNVCLDPARPLQPMVVVSCQDCLTRIGVPQALLTAGTTSYQLAQQLTDHQRLRRNFSLSRSGYHAAGPGFWLSIIHYAPGLFLLNAERSRQLGSDLDVLMLALQHNVIPMLDPQMRDPKQYRLETVHVNFAQFQPNVSTKQAFLAAPQCRTQPQTGWQKVTLAEYLPLIQAAAARTPAPAPAPTTNGTAKPAATPAPTAKTAPTTTKPVKLKLGDRCTVCGAEVKDRPLFNGSFIGCLCG